MKNEKNWVFVFQKYGKFWSVSLGHFIKHKPLISNEWSYMHSNFWLLIFTNYWKLCIKFSSAYKTIESHQKSRDSEVAQLQAMLRKTEMQTTNLEHTVE